MPTDADEIRSQVAGIAGALARRSLALRDDLLARLLADVAELRRDEAVHELMAASVLENVTAGLGVVASGVAVDAIEPPASAAEYARRLAQHGVRVDALLRGYQVGHRVFLDWWLREMRERSLPAEDQIDVLEAVTRTSFFYVERICAQLVAVYAAEQEHWAGSAAAARAAAVCAMTARGWPTPSWSWATRSGSATSGRSSG